jgi:hypothetical protein
MSDVLTRLADEIEGHAHISARPGQLADLERIAAELRAERDRFHSWAGLMALLDECYPADIFTGMSGDPGPRIVVLLREINQIRSEIEAKKAGRGSS